MTAAEQLRQASETLRRLADGATPGPWWPSHSEPSPHRPPYAYDVEGGDDGYGPMFSGLFGDAALIALMDPDLARMLADWLDEAAAWAEELPEWTDPQALALAEHINERTSHG